MKRTAILVGLVIAFLGGAPAVAFDRLWWGGGIGLAFGDVDYIAVEPVLGFTATKDLSVGAGLIYRYRDDGRFDPNLTTADYGWNVFARYRLARFAFLQAEYEHLSYEFVRVDGSTFRDDYDSPLAGVGFVQPMRGRTSFFATILYNFAYDDDEPSPYDDPWVYRVGVTVGF